MLDKLHKETAQNVFKSIPYIKLLGMELVKLEKGKATVTLQMRDELRQPFGLLHGGATASLIDTATAFANVTIMKENEKASTVDLNVHYLRPVIEGMIICEAKIVKAGKRISTIAADVADENGKLIATALSTYTKF